MFALTPIVLLILGISAGGISTAAEHHADKSAAIETAQAETVQVREDEKEPACENDTPERDCRQLADAAGIATPGN